MPVKTGCASDFNKNSREYVRLPDSGTVILITRGRPYPWVDYDEWTQVLSPRLYTKNRWMISKQTEEDWQTYLSEFKSQMIEPGPIKKIEEMHERVKNGETITFLCYCKKGEQCHRDIIKSLLTVYR